MEQHLKDQISDIDGLENMESVSDFFDHVSETENHNLERQFRTRGKHHESVIGKNNSAIESMIFACGGELHNQIGIANDSLKCLFKDLKSENLEERINLC